MNIIFDTEEKLRSIEKQLEEIGSNICNLPGSYPCFAAINNAIVEVQDAICSTCTIET